MILHILAAISPDQFNVPKGDFTSATFGHILQVVFGLAGAIAVLVISLGGFRYIVGQGNPQETTQAKNTILYAIVGLFVCIAAYSIVTFVVDKL